MSSLYKDAIADARKLRETAEQNAKNRIIEAIAPKLRRMIERQISEGEDEFVDDSAELDGLLDTPEAMDMLDDEAEMELPMDEPMAMSPEPMDIDTDGFSSVEVIPDEEDSSDDESQNKSVHVNITVEGKKNHQLRRRAILLVKALSEAKSVGQRNKIRKQIVRLRSQLIITENRQNERLANNLSVILKESNTMRKRKNSWLFEGKDGEAGEEMEMEDAEFDDEDLDVDAIKMAVADLASAVGMEMSDDDGMEEEDEEFDIDDEEEEDAEFEDEDLEEYDEMGDETYESMRESDEMADEEDEGDDEMVEVNEAMLRRALGVSRKPAQRSRKTSRLSETRRRRIARARRQRRLAEGEAKAMASSFGGGKLGKEMFVDVDENTLLNALAEELGNHGNATASQGKAAAKASHFGGGTIKKGGVMESRVRRANRKAVLAERKARAVKKELNESNLFNAKLLYVTKLMQQHTLNNKQQRAIVEAMDNAKTQREAKLLFKSLNESLNKRSAQKLTESKNTKKSINESRTGYSNRSLQSGQAPRNSGVELDRWAILAGIRK
jgi:hypothetical protein